MVEEEKVQTRAWYNSSLEYLQDRLFLNAQLSLSSALGERSNQLTLLYEMNLSWTSFNNFMTNYNSDFFSFRFK